MSILCKDCSYFDPALFPSHFSDCCGNKEAPHTDFLTGYKSPTIINEDGECKYFSLKMDEYINWLYPLPKSKGEIKIVSTEEKKKRGFFRGIIFK